MIIKRTYFLCCVVALMVLACTLPVAQAAARFNESDSIAVLQSGAPKAEKATACKELAICGTERAVPALAPLLGDAELTSWARIALEVIPGSAADAALRSALGQVQGRALIGVINSIGVRRDARAVDALTQKLSHANAEVAGAAAVALGHIGGEAAARVLTQSLGTAAADRRSAVAEGCILCAEGFLTNDRPADAVRLYDAVRQADVPDQRHLEGIRGAILARQSEGVPLLIEQLRSEDTKRLGVGLRTARELPGRQVTEALAEELQRLDADRRPLLLLALADRKDDAVLPVVHQAAQDGQKELRLTAIKLLIHLGDVSCVPVLLKAATEGDAGLEQAAKETLVRLAGKEVDADLLGRMDSAQGKLQQVLIELAGQRQINAALPLVVSSLQQDDTQIRGTAIKTVGIIGQASQVADLVGLLQKTDSSRERTEIENALLAISDRSGVQCIPSLQPLIQSRDSELQMIGLHALATIGGPLALAPVQAAMKVPDAAVQDEAVRTLSTWPNNWPEDQEAGQALLALVSSAEKMSHQVLALRGYLQYLRGTKTLDPEQKVTKVRQIQTHINRPAEKRQAIAVLGEAPSAAALEFLLELAEEKSVAEESYSALVRVAGQDVAGISKDQRQQVLGMVIEKTQNNGTRRRAQQARNRIR